MAKKVLLVEDDKLVRQSLAQVLQSKDIEVDEATAGEAGLKKALDSPPDLVVTDVHMPGMDGLEMVAKIHDDPRGKDLPVIVLSNDDQATTLNQALQAGVTTYLSKANLDADAIADQIVIALG